jgi:CubicO group peptidase (beta-lactamase class C family)
LSAKPESVGLSSSRLVKIDRFLKERYIESGKIPNAHVVVARRGEVVHSSVMGLADVERKKPLKDDTIFRIYSMTKPVTSVAFMMLVEEGLVALDDPVHKHIPEWRDLGVYKAGTGPFQTTRPSRPMLVVDLMRHTSGLTYGFQQRTNVDAAYRQSKLGEIEKHGTLDTMVEALSKLPLEFSPGDAWNYSVSTDILGYLIGKIAKQPFEEFLRKRIFEPLGMIDTDFQVPADKAERLAACYQAAPGGKMVLQDDPAKSPFLSVPSFISGGGGLVSTAKDYLQFAKMLAGGGSLGKVQIISPKTLQLMTSNHLPGGKDIATMSISLFSEATYAGVGFGLGFAVTTDPAKTLIPATAGDFFWGGAASTFFWVDPKEELIAMFLTQLMPSTTYPVRREFRTLVYSAFMESNERYVAPQQPQMVVGGLAPPNIR